MLINSNESIFYLPPVWEDVSKKIEEKIKKNVGCDIKILQEKIFRCLGEDFTKAPLLFLGKTLAKAKVVLNGNQGEFYSIIEIFYKRFPLLRKNIEKQIDEAEKMKQLFGLAVWLIESGKAEILIYRLKDLNFSLEESLALCQEIASQGERVAFILVNYFGKLGIIEKINSLNKDVEKRLDFYLKIAEKGEWAARALVKNFKKLGLEKVSAKKRLTLCCRIACQGGVAAEVLARNFRRFEIESTDSKECLELCYKIISQGECAAKTLIKNFEDLLPKKTSIQERLALYKKAASQGEIASEALANNFENLGLEKVHVQERLTLCQAIASKGAWSANALAKNFYKLGLEKLKVKERLALCNEIISRGEWAADALAKNFDRLGFEKAGIKQRLGLCYKIIGQGELAAKSVAENFEKFGLEKISIKERLDLCCKIVEQKAKAAEALAKSIEKFSLEKASVDERLILCFKIASQGGCAAETLANNFHKFDVEKASVDERLLLCEEIASQGDWAAAALVCNIEEFGLKKASIGKLFFLYCKIVSQGDRSAVKLLENFEKFSLEKMGIEKRLILCHKIADQGEWAATELACRLKKFKLIEASIENLLFLCQEIASQGYSVMVTGLTDHFDSLGIIEHFFRIQDLEERLKLLHEIVDQGVWAARGVARNFDKFDLKKVGIAECLTLCFKIANFGEAEAAELARNFEKLGMERASDNERLELCKNIVKQGEWAANALAKNFLSIGISKEERRQILLELLAPPAPFRLYCSQELIKGLADFLNIAPLVALLLKEETNTLLPLEIEDLGNFLQKNKKLKEIFYPLLGIVKQEKSEYVRLQLFQWIAYSAGVLFEQEEKRLDQISKSKILFLILKYRAPVNRFALVRQLTLLESSDLIKQEKMLRPWAVLSWILFARLKQLGVGEKELGSILEKVNKIREFKDTKQLNILIALSLQLIEKSPYRANEGKEIANKIIEVLSEANGKKEKLRDLQILLNILKIFGREPFLECLHSKKDCRQFFFDKFRTLFDVGEVENFSERYQETFGSFRDTAALYTYLASLENLPREEREKVKKELNFYVKAVLGSSFLEVRYSTKKSAHLKVVFADPAVKKLWCQKAPPEVVECKGAISEQNVDYKSFFYKKIVRDKHLNPEDFPLLCDYLEGKKVEVKEEKGEPKEQFQAFAVALCKGRETAEGFIRKVRGLKMLFGEFSNDLLTLIPKTGSSNYTLSESDDPCDLLLLGTEVKGSCLRVDGDAQFNKCLLSYLMNGEIRAIVVKAGSRIVARSILRLMWDKKMKSPILLLEGIYSNVKDNAIKEAIQGWAKRKAHTMDISLVSKEVGKGIPYFGKVSARKGFASYVYSDASGGIRKGAFKVAGCHFLEPVQNLFDI